MRRTIKHWRQVVCFGLAALVPMTALGLSASLCAEDDPPAAAEPQTGTPQEQFVALERDVYKAFKEEKFDLAIEKCQAQLKLFPKQAGPYYNMACAQARQEKKEAALASLAKSIELGYNEAEHMQADTDLTCLREEKKFAELTEGAKANAKKNPPGYEPGKEIRGLKSVEEMPEGGLRYRLRLSDQATREKPHRLVIWLHPSGGSGNEMVESQLALDLARHGYVLMVMSQKQWRGWDGREADMLLNKTLPAALKQAGVAPEKPILLGYSAGGQLALQLWAQNPTGFGGLILDAAYPLDMELYMKGKQAPMKLPQDEGIGKVPVYVLVGTADGGSQMWNQVEKPWRKAGLPLTMDYVENGKHQWLIGPAQKKRLLAWLDEVAAGKFPGRQEAARDVAGDEPAAAGAEGKADALPADPPAKKALSKPDDGLGDQEY